MPGLMEKHRVPGAIVAVVQGRRVVALEGYGRADREEERAMSPDSTLLRTASVSKTMTATLLRALAEEGRLDLDAPVYDLPAGYDSTTTLAHLLAHTGGLDGRLLGSGRPRPPASLTVLLQRRLPPQIDPPGTLSRYSNEGYAWAGDAVARQLDEPFQDLANRHVFAPLGMTQSTFVPGGGERAPQAATGYTPTEAGYDPLIDSYVTMPPAGGFWTTGRDMSRFLTAVLQSGRLDTLQALPAAAVSFARGPITDAHAGRRSHLGWFRRVIHGQPAFVHDGTYPGAGSHLAVIPGENLAVFLGGNARGAASMASEVVDVVLNGRSAAPFTAPAAVPTDLSRLEGSYRIARRPHTTFESFFTLFGIPYPDVRVEAVGDTAATVHLADGPRTLRHIGGGHFVAPDGSIRESIAVTEGAGPVPRLRIGAATFERVPTLALSTVGLSWLGICLLAFGSVFILPIREFFRPGTTDDDEAPEGMQYARPLATFAAALHIGFLFALAFRIFTGGPLSPVFTDPASIRPLLAFPIMASVLSVGLLVFVVRAWLTDAWTLGTRLHFSVVTLGMLAYIPFLLYWDLIGMPVA